MKASRTLFSCSLIALASAQTPSNFSVVSSASLDVIGEPGNVNIIPGSLLAQSDVLDSPTIYSPSNTSDTTYVAFMIDPTTNMGNFLHWFQPNLVSDSSGQLSVDVTVKDASTAVGAKYIYPQPPDDGYAHEYVILLYQQPSDWAVPSNYSTYNPPAAVSDRFGFDMYNFQHAAGLSAPVGTDYFRVINGTSAQSSTVASASPTAVSTSSAGVTSASTTATTTTSASTSASASATGNSAAANGLAQLVIAGAFAVPLLL